MVYKERFINPDQINEILVMIRSMALEQGFEAVLAGGVALQVYGSTNLTSDVDFVLNALPEDKGSLRKLRPIGFGGESYIHPNGGKLDLIVRNDEYTNLYADALAKAVTTPEGIQVVTPEHLAAMKQAAGREKDMLALKWLIRQPDLLDIKSTRALVYRFMGRYAQDRFDDIVDQALIEKEMQRRRGRDPEEE
jgi:hypothetical protein